MLIYIRIYIKKEGIDDRAGQRSMLFVTYMLSYASSGQGAAHRQKQSMFGCKAFGITNIDTYVSIYRKKVSTIEPDRALSFSLHTRSLTLAADRKRRIDKDSLFWGWTALGITNIDVYVSIYRKRYRR